MVTLHAKLSCGANPEFLGAWINVLIPNCQINAIFVTFFFIFVVKEEEEQVLANVPNDFKPNL